MVFKYFASALLITILVLQVSSSPLQYVSPNKYNPMMTARDINLGNSIPCTACMEVLNATIGRVEKLVNTKTIVDKACGVICGAVTHNTIENYICEFICKKVGAKPFEKVLGSANPNPIGLCQTVSICPKVTTGKVVKARAEVFPRTAAVGTTFDIEFDYDVEDVTGPGILTATVVSPQGVVLQESKFQDGQEDGKYLIRYNLNTNTTVSASASAPATASTQGHQVTTFAPGVYTVQMVLCEGDCKTSTYGGVYAQATTKFTVTA